MRFLMAWFWMCLILASILWYTFLLFYVGIKGASEIISLGRNLSRKPEARTVQEPVRPENSRKRPGSLDPE